MVAGEGQISKFDFFCFICYKIDIIIAKGHLQPFNRNCPEKKLLKKIPCGG